MWSKILTLVVAGLMLAKAEVFQDTVPAHDLPQERSPLSFLNVQTEHETDLNSIYVPVKSPEYFPSNAVFYLPQGPQQYAYNAPLFPTPGFYGPSTSYIDHYLSKPFSQLSVVEESLNKIPSESPAIVLLNKPNNLHLYTTSKPLPEQNLSELFSNLIQNQPKDWIFYNAASAPKESLGHKSPNSNKEQFKNPTKDSDKAAALEALLGLLDKKPDKIVTSIIKPEILVETLKTNPKPTIPTTTSTSTTDALLENLVQKLLSRKRVEERLGAFYLRNSFLNRK